MPTRNEHLLDHPDHFADRHVGPRDADVAAMLAELGVASLDELIAQTVPEGIRAASPLALPAPLSESAAVARLRELAARNQIWRSFIGTGYSDCVTPAPIVRYVLENPGWYTQYTPYQAEISQGRLEALLNFQTMIADLTGLPIANASMLDEGTAAAEAMTLCRRAGANKDRAAVFFVSERCHPQTIAVVKTRALPLEIEVVVGNHETWDFSRPTFGALVEYPATCGEVVDYAPFVAKAHAAKCAVVVAADLLALTLLKSPGEIGADVAVGSSQRFGVPLSYGGPHAGYMAAREEFKRQIPGRIIGVSRDAQGKPALRLALQTREQHIRREKATSNICTAQVLLAVMASMYAVYHGPEGLKKIAGRVHLLAETLRGALRGLGCGVGDGVVFDALRVVPGPRPTSEVLEAAAGKKINLRVFEDGALGVALDEATTAADLQDLYEVFGGPTKLDWEALAASAAVEFPAGLRRGTPFMQEKVFNRYHCEMELMRYIKSLESRDLSLAQAMTPLGSCTMKLNGAAEMFAITWPEFAKLHPFAPAEQAAGYQELAAELTRWLTTITGFHAATLMPNSGAAGEYTGLQVIRAYHHSRGDARRKVCIIPESAHGTNPASAALAGMEVVPVKCNERGDIDVDDLKAKAEAHRDTLAALMVTYPSTHGVFEEGIKTICKIVHDNGGQVYVDGANMNALVGLCRPADFGGDLCHLNLHKTFSIPHGGGGPGVGPICVAKHLAAFLPKHPVVPTGGERGIGAVASGPMGSAGVLPIPYAYIAMMGTKGLEKATKTAILNANYLAVKLAPHFPIVYTGKNGRVAHECIIDLKPVKQAAGIEADDIAKRLMDYGFHAPTMSWPVHDSLMIEPTESESKEELDRFVEAMVMIREEIREIEEGKADRADNLLKNAPHTAAVCAADDWKHPYSRERAAFPTQFTKERKFWPYVGRVDNVAGDRNLVCTCMG